MMGDERYVEDDPTNVHIQPAVSPIAYAKYLLMDVSSDLVQTNRDALASRGDFSYHCGSVLKVDRHFPEVKGLIQPPMKMI